MMKELVDTLTAGRCKEFGRFSEWSLIEVSLYIHNYMNCSSQLLLMIMLFIKMV